MSYAKSNPLFELDIYRSQLDNSWNFFLSIFRWSFSVQLSKAESDDFTSSNHLLDGNYSAISEQEDDEWLEYWANSVEGEEHLDDDHEYHELEGVYYSNFSDQFIEVSKCDDSSKFNLKYQKGFPYADEKVVDYAIDIHIENGTWEKVMSP